MRRGPSDAFEGDLEPFVAGIADDFEFRYTVSDPPPDLVVPETSSAVLEEPVASSEPATVPHLAELYVNVGRRDGASEDTLYDALLERAGIRSDEIASVDLRQNNCYVRLHPSLLDRAAQSLTGTTLVGRQVLAERARPRR